MDGRRFDGARLIVEFARERPAGATPARRASEFRMLVEGLPRDTSWQDLKDHIRTAGDCMYVNTVDGGTRGVVDYRFEGFGVFVCEIFLKYLSETRQNSMPQLPS